MTKLEQLYDYKKRTEALGFPVPEILNQQIKDEEDKQLKLEVMPALHHNILTTLKDVNRKLVFMVELDPEKDQRVNIACANNVEEWFDGNYIATISQSDDSRLVDIFASSDESQVPNDDNLMPPSVFAVGDDNDTTQQTVESVDSSYDYFQKLCPITVVRPNGTKIERPQTVQVLVDTIKEIGARKVAELNLRCNNDKLITVGKVPNKKNSQQHDVGDGYFIDTHTNTGTKVNQLKEIFRQLHLDEWKVLYDNPDQDYENDRRKKESLRSKGFSSRSNLRVYLQDGRIIENVKAVDTLIEVIKLAGPHRVQGLGFKLCGYDFISDELCDDPRYLPSQRPVGDGLYALCYNGTEDKKKMIETISDRFNLGLRVEIFIPKLNK